MFADFMQRCSPAEHEAVLDVGVTDEPSPDANYFERLYPHQEHVTAAGLMEASPFSRIHYVQISGSRLPFGDKEFDVVHSSAVLEHVGSWRAQRDFLAELWRVCRRVLYVTTPNRWAPVEFHTGLPFVHWLPRRWWEACARLAGHAFYAEERNLNLLWSRRLACTASFAGVRDAKVTAVRLCGWPSNLVLTAQR
jgi:hypothetical protein